MGKFILNDHLTKDPNHTGLQNTYLGQASIAGNGPESSTCRECKFWCRKMGKNGPEYKYDGYVVNHGDLKRGYCFFPIHNKAHALFPHFAESCSLFENSDAPPPVKNPSTIGRAKGEK